jgi:transcriptional regulator with XRE-family HTH domain
MAMAPNDEFEIQQVKDIGSFFRQLRFKRNKSQREMANELGCSQATLTRFELAQDGYRFSQLQKIARGYGYRLEISVVPMDENIDTRIVAKPDPEVLVPVNGVRDTKHGRNPSEITSSGDKYQGRKKSTKKYDQVTYEDDEEFDIEAEMAAMRARLAS